MWFLALLALPIFGLCAPLDAIIAKRQVDTSQLRSATRRLTARAGGSSPQPALIGGPPTFPTSERVASQRTVRTQRVTVYANPAFSRQLNCVYVEGGTGSGFNCQYNADTGALRTDISDVGCATQARTAAQTGACYTGCPAQTTSGAFYTGSQLDTVNNLTTCYYADTAASAQAGAVRLNCLYSATNGRPFSLYGSPNARCPASIPITTECLNLS